MRTAVAMVAVLAGATVAAVMLANDVRRPPLVEVALFVAVSWSFAGSGLVAWQLRPDNRVGPAMITTSLLWSFSGLYWSQDPIVFSVGHSAQALYLAGIIYVLLAFPDGRLTSRSVRWLAIAGLVAAGPLEVAFLMLGGHARATMCTDCPAMVFSVLDAGGLALALQLVQYVVGLTVVASSFGVLVRRWRHATPAQRFAVAPVLWAGAVAAPVLAFWVADEAVGSPFGSLAGVALDVVLIAIAGSFLVGVARTRLARGAVAALMLELAEPHRPTALQDVLARTLHDPSLMLAYWLPDREHFVDAHGAAVTLPGADERRAITMIERDGKRIAALVHDPALTDGYLMRSVCVAAGLTLENERLQADLRAQLAEVQASRARIVEATQDERRRIERDLHDGAQQRLVSVAMSLGLAEAKLLAEPSRTSELIAESRAGVAAALVELRELSRGIHPGILTERGLGQALDDLVLRMRMPVDVDVDLAERLPQSVETAAYYVVAEGLTNIAKYAHATNASVCVARKNGDAVLEIVDDGTGGADPSRGSGLRGLRDRVEALGGRFVVTSPQGSGTRIRAEIPCE